MNAKQKWLLEHLLLPVGFLPPVVTLSDFQTYEKTRQHLQNCGFEYFYMLGQNFDDIPQTVLKGKIRALHSPWPTFGPIDDELAEPVRTIVDFLIMRNRRLPKNLMERTRMSLEFAKQLGAKVIVSHISFFDHHKLKEQLTQFAELEKEFGIPIAIEHDGPYVYTHIKKGKFYLTVDGNLDWMISPVKMSKALNKIFPQKQFGICYDSASLISAELPLIENAKPILEQIIHVHLASNKVGPIDKALEIDRPEIVDIVKLLFESKYNGYITAEVHGSIGKNEDLLVKLHTALSLLGIDILRPKVIANAQSHISSSSRYLLDHLK